MQHVLDTPLVYRRRHRRSANNAVLPSNVLPELPCGLHNIATMRSRSRRKLARERPGVCILGGVLGFMMSLRYQSRLALVRVRIEELENCVSDTLVVSVEARDELRELYAEADFLEQLAA